MGVAYLIEMAKPYTCNCTSLALRIVNNGSPWKCVCLPLDVVGPGSINGVHLWKRRFPQTWIARIATLDLTTLLAPSISIMTEGSPLKSGTYYICPAEGCSVSTGEAQTNNNLVHIGKLEGPCSYVVCTSSVTSLLPKMWSSPRYWWACVVVAHHFQRERRNT